LSARPSVTTMKQTKWVLGSGDDAGWKWGYKFFIEVQMFWDIEESNSNVT
jgi:hypothetical protein